MTEKIGLNRALPKNELILGLVIGIVAIVSIAYIDTSGIFKPVDSVESAKQHMIGTWTYTEPIDFNDDPFPVYWVKWTINLDGTMTVWHAHPQDASWGNGETAKYEVVTNKYGNTGERWYGIIDPDGFTTGVYENGTIMLHGIGQQHTGKMKEGDKNPFSS
ncbi:MAG: hypothetical protein HOP06_10250 [Methylotenera sp.]|nr:hypothetical protein [Methylotenera sp.]